MYKPALDFLAELALTGYTGRICIDVETDQTVIDIATILNCRFIEHVAEKFDYQASAVIKGDSTIITLQHKSKEL